MAGVLLAEGTEAQGMTAEPVGCSAWLGCVCIGRWYSQTPPDLNKVLVDPSVSFVGRVALCVGESDKGTECFQNTTSTREAEQPSRGVVEWYRVERAMEITSVTTVGCGRFLPSVIRNKRRVREPIRVKDKVGGDNPDVLVEFGEGFKKEPLDDLSNHEDTTSNSARQNSLN